MQLCDVTLVGHSMGSLAALDCAARYPERISSIALLGTTAPMPVAGPLLNAAVANDPAAFELLTQWGYSRRNRMGGNANPGVWMTGSTMALMERTAPGVLAADLNACNDYRAGLERAAGLRCPTLLLLGEEDRLTPVASTAALQAAIPELQLTIVPGSGHTLMVEATSQTIAGLRSFLETQTPHRD